MRFTWHKGEHHADRDDERTEPAWATGRPVETAGTLRISAPKAADLAHEHHAAA